MSIVRDRVLPPALRDGLAALPGGSTSPPTPPTGPKVGTNDIKPGSAAGEAYFEKADFIQKQLLINFADP